MVIHVLPPGFCRRPVGLCSSAFIRQPSPVGLCSSAVPALVPSRFALAFGDGWRGVDGVALASLGLRDGFGLLWDARPPSARPWRLEFLVSCLAVSVSECKVMASLLPRCAIGCAAVRTRAIMCDEMQWGWKSGLLRRETNEYVFLHVHVVSIDFSFEAEQALRGSFTGRRGSGR